MNRVPLSSGRKQKNRKDRGRSNDVWDEEEGEDMALTNPEPDLDEQHIYRLLDKVNGSAGYSQPLLDHSKGMWTMQEVEAAWSAYKARASAAYRGGPARYDYIPEDAPDALKDYYAKIGASVVSAETVALDIPPLAREELESRIMHMGRGKKNPTAARETLKAIKQSGKMKVSPETAAFILEELMAAKKMLTTDPHMRSDPYFQYQLLGIKQALKNLSQLSGNVTKGPASAILAMVEESRDSLLSGGRLDLAEVESLVRATAAVLRAKEGKCPEDGCVVKRGDDWRVVSNKTGKLWPQTYDTKEDAEDALAAYHIRKKG